MFLNTRKERDFFVSFVLFGSLLGLLSGPIIYVYSLYQKHEGKIFYAKIKNNPQVYIYDTFFPALNPAMYITSTEDYARFSGFYKKWINKSDSNYLVFPIRYLSFDYPMYVLNYHLSDSNLIEVVDMDTSNYDYTKCVVFKGTVHINPPNDTLLANYKKIEKTRDSLNGPYLGIYKH